MGAITGTTLFGAILNGQCSNLNDAFLSILFVIAAVCVLGAATTAYGLAGAQQKKKSTRASPGHLPGIRYVGESHHAPKTLA
mmetsp:Transcript_50285/g.163801  ORF Transcript_50285/g.163801 Transcript_50285/m.163801 type:complete len:82 (+) Transcript_50285:1946-2191(+)